MRGATRQHGSLTARRSVVLDAQDQRMQLALALHCRAANWPAVRLENSQDGGEGVIMEVSLCLLTMEEDEVADAGGFPLILNNPDDEHLLVTEERFHSPLDVTAVTTTTTTGDGDENGDGGDVVPVARRVLGKEGVVQFRIDTSELRQTTRYCFRHEETGAELQIRVSPQRSSLSESEAADRESDREVVDMTAGDHMVEEQFSEDELSNEYENDGFLVGDDHEAEEDDDDDDVCCLCHDGGEMIVCDGGDNLAGCGNYYHIVCIHREEIPPGDWVCEGCANEFGLTNVGIEGHEFPAPDQQQQDNGSSSPRDKSRRKRRQSNATAQSSSSRRRRRRPWWCTL